MKITRASILLFVTLLFAGGYSSAQVGEKASPKATPAAEDSGRPRIHIGSSGRRNSETAALSSPRIARLLGKSLPKCTGQKVLNLSGTYSGVYFLNKDDKEGVPATLKITGSNFELISDSLNGTGTISALNSCGDTSVALKFQRALGTTAATISTLLRQTISLEARVAGSSGAAQGDIASFTSDRAVILSTLRDESGNFAGADIGFVICPKYPKCKRYPSCPCPDPSKSEDP